MNNPQPEQTTKRQQPPSVTGTARNLQDSTPRSLPVPIAFGTGVQGRYVRVVLVPGTEPPQVSITVAAKKQDGQNLLFAQQETTDLLGNLVDQATAIDAVNVLVTGVNALLP